MKNIIKIIAFIIAICILLELITVQLRKNLDDSRSGVFGGTVATIGYNGKYQCVYPWDIGNESDGWDLVINESRYYECMWDGGWVNWIKIKE